MRQKTSLIPFAKELRNNSTEAEHLLWRHLRQSQLADIKFRRQQPIKEYIADFVSFTPKLVIELDGGQHAEHHVYDAKRDACLRKNGFIVLRFWNNEVFTNIDGVLELIRRHAIMTASTPTPQPPPARGGGLSADLLPHE